MPKIKEVAKDNLVKVKRVDGQKLNPILFCQYYQENPDIRERLLNYEEVEIPESVFKELYGLKIVDKKVEE